MPQKTTLLTGIRTEDVLNEELRTELGAEEDQKTRCLTLSQLLPQINEWKALSRKFRKT